MLLHLPGPLHDLYPGQENGLRAYFSPDLHRRVAGSQGRMSELQVLITRILIINCYSRERGDVVDGARGEKPVIAVGE